MKLSVVILNYNVRYFLELCIQSVEAALVNIPSEIIVVDNHSSDDSCSVVKSQYPHVTLIENKSNIGFAKANNQAVAQAKGEYVCILNPDTVVPENGFESLLTFAETKSDLGILGCRLIDGSGQFLPESKRNVPYPTIALQKILGYSKPYYAQHLPSKAIGQVDILVGALMIIKRSVYNKLEGFDEDYFMYAEDIDISFKALKLGYNNYYYGQTSVIHFKGESTHKNKQYTKRFYGAMQKFYSKHLRTNLLTDSLVNLGVRLAMNFQKQPVQPPHKSYHFSLISTQPQSVWIDRLDPNIVSLDDLVSSPPTTVVFDSTTVSFAAIIKHMERFSANDMNFRIISKSNNFMIGSDDAINHGVVTQF